MRLVDSACIRETKEILMSKENRPVALQAKEAPLRAIQSMYPAPFAKLTEGREKRVLGDAFGLTNFGVNFVTLAPHSVLLALNVR